MKKYLFLIYSFVTIAQLKAQLPNSDVWLFSYSNKLEKYTFSNGTNISSHQGYDNQPSFSKDGNLLLYTSERDSSQTDIFCYSINKGTKTSKFQTKVSEYSPEFFTSLNNYFSAVVVEEDSSQRLWIYDLSCNDANCKKSELAFPAVKNVAYSRWLNDSIVFLSLLPEPMTLYIANRKTKVIEKCASNINRSMAIYHQKNNTAFLYTQLQSDSTFAIQALNTSGTQVPNFKPIKMIEGSLDFSIDKLGHIFMASGAKLFIWTIGKSKEWTEVGNFASEGLHKITRISISPDGKHIAIVDNPK